MQLIKFSFVFFIIILLSCSRVNIDNYNNGIGMKIKIPIWQFINNVQIPELKIEYENYTFRYDTNLITNCHYDYSYFSNEVKLVLEREEYIVSHNATLNQVRANKEHFIDLEKVNINVIIYFQKPIFQHSIYVSSMNLKFSATSSFNISRESLEKYATIILDKVCGLCQTPVYSGLRYLINRGGREPKTKDEEKIYENFGEEGLKAIDAIDGRNDVSEIIRISGIDEQKFYLLIEYLLKNNYIKFKE